MHGRMRADGVDSCSSCSNRHHARVRGTGLFHGIMTSSTLRIWRMDSRKRKPGTTNEKKGRTTVPTGSCCTLVVGEQIKPKVGVGVCGLVLLHAVHGLAELAAPGMRDKTVDQWWAAIGKILNAHDRER